MRYRVVEGDRGIEVDGRRTEPGEHVELDDETAAWLTSKGLIEPAPAVRRAAKTSTVEDGE